MSRFSPVRIFVVAAVALTAVALGPFVPGSALACDTCSDSSGPDSGTPDSGGTGGSGDTGRGDSPQSPSGYGPSTIAVPRFSAPTPSDGTQEDKVRRAISRVRELAPTTAPPKGIIFGPPPYGPTDIQMFGNKPIAPSNLADAMLRGVEKQYQREVEFAKIHEATRLGLVVTGALATMVIGVHVLTVNILKATGTLVPGWLEAMQARPGFEAAAAAASLWAGVDAFGGQAKESKAAISQVVEAAKSAFGIAQDGTASSKSN